MSLHVERSAQLQMFFDAMRNPAIDDISPIIKELSEEEKEEHLNTPSVQFVHLTPAAYALYRENVMKACDIFDSLSESKKRSFFQSKDHQGWTTPHHAAITDRQFYRMLKEEGAHLRVKNKSAGSPGFLRKLLGLSRRTFSGSQCKLFFRPPGENEDILITGQELKTRYGDLFAHKFEEFTTFYRTDRETLYLSRHQAPHAFDREHHFFKTFAAYYERLKVTEGIEENVALRKVEVADGNEDIGFGIFAVRPLPQGSMVTCYGGDIVDESRQKDLVFSLAVTAGLIIESGRRRSLGAMANHGMPNAAFTYINVGGIYVSVLIALKQIKTGEQVVVDYGPDYFKKNAKALELGEKHMIDFVHLHPLKSFYETLKNLNALTFDQWYIHTSWTYIICSNMTRLIQLVLKGHIPHADALHFYTIFKFVHDLKNDSSNIEIYPGIVVETINLLPVITAFRTKYSFEIFKQVLELVEKKNPRASLIADRLIKYGYTDAEFNSIFGPFDS